MEKPILVGNEIENEIGDGWDGGALGANGNIYGIPFDATQVLKFNPTTRQTSTVGTAFEGHGKWSGGVVANNGIIYGIPYNASQFLRFDPSTETATLIEVVGNEGEGIKWSGGVVAQNGMIYCAPFHGSLVLKLNPSNDKTSILCGYDIIVDEIVEMEQREISSYPGWAGGVVANNGCVYFIPSDAKQVLRLNPFSESTVLIGDKFEGSRKWRSGVLANNGYIYAIPLNASKILMIDPTNDVTVLVGPDLGIGDLKWTGSLLGRNGYIYGIPYGRSSVLRFNPRSQTTVTIRVGNDIEELGGLCMGGVVAPNGVIYGIPSDAQQMLMFEPFLFDPSRNAQAGINDSPHDGPDRLGYQLYADALVRTALMVEAPSSSLCVGLYAPWGSGKTFLWRLIMKTLKAVEEAARKRHEQQDNEATEETARDEHDPSNEAPDSKRFVLVTFDVICFLLMKATTQKTINDVTYQSLLYLPHISHDSEQIRRQRSELHEIVATKFALWFPLLLILSPLHLLPIRVKKWIREKLLEYTGIGAGDYDVMKDHGDSVWKVLTGETCVGRGHRWQPSTSQLARSLLLRGIQSLSLAVASCLKGLRSVWSLVAACFGNTVCCNCTKLGIEDDTKDGLTKHIFVEFNAWVYSGSDLLWASLIEELWRAVENVTGKNEVRLDRASIELSDEDPDDTLREKQEKRQEALYKYHLNWYISTIVCGVGTIATVAIITFGPRVQNSISDLTILTGVAIEIVALIPFASQIYTLIKKVWPELRKSRGERILEEAESYQRKDFSEKTGFMGEVRQEVHYLFDFLKTYQTKNGESLRLVLFVDDLDRCPKDIVVRVLQAVILLLADAPVTCWLAIDSRIVVTSIEEYFGEVFAEAGISGHDFLDKVVQLPFCIPDMSDGKKNEYCERLALNQVLTVKGIYERLKLHFQDHLGWVPPTGTREAMLNSILEFLGEGSRLSSIVGALVSSDPSFSMKYDQVKQLVEEAEMDDRNLDDLLHFLWRAIAAMTPDERKSIDPNTDGRNADDGLDTRASNVSPARGATQTQSPDVGTIPSNQTTNRPADVTTLSQGAGPLLDGKLDPSGTTTTLECEPMLNEEERRWLRENSGFVSGKPRTIKRILNVFNVARHIASHSGHTDTESLKKLLKFIILLEQWPYRMAWLIQIAQDVIQEHAIIVDEKSGTLRCPGRTLSHFCSLLLHAGPHPLKADTNGLQRMYQELDLSKVYKGIVQSLMHALRRAEMLLRRDGDAQLFEMFLKSNPQLTLGDLEFPPTDGKSESVHNTMNLRNYGFNLPRSMLERVSTYADTHTFEPKYNEDDNEDDNEQKATSHPKKSSQSKATWYPVFSKKSSVYDQVQDSTKKSSYSPDSK